MPLGVIRLPDSLSLAEARRVALAAQGFTFQDRAKKVTWSHMASMIGRLNLLQIDSVNVLIRSHYLPLFSRLGNYPRATLDERSFGNRNRALFECWAHEASLLPLELHPLMRWRMARARAGDGTYASMNRFGQEEKRYLRQVLGFVRRNGPTAARDVPGGGKAEGGWWGWSRGKLALETLFDQGNLTTATREGFERIYDIPERVIPPEFLSCATPSESEAIRRLVLLSGRAHGIGTEKDLRDYFRLPGLETRRALAELVEEGTFIPVKVEGWKQTAYLHRDQAIPRKAGGSALLSPFDPIVWERSRAERLFNFNYRIEIYTPAPKRQFGYYVLPFLHGETIAGRVCLKADRQAGVLRANAIHHEPHVDAGETAEALASELQLLARWLGLDAVAAGHSGNLAPALARALA